MVLLGAGQLIQLIFKRYRSLLQRKVEDKSDIIKFAFTFGSIARAHLCRYVKKQRQEVLIRRRPCNALLFKLTIPI